MNKNILAVIFILVGVALIWFGFSYLTREKGTWLCTTEGWQPEGKPSVPMPESLCALKINNNPDSDTQVIFTFDDAVYYENKIVYGTGLPDNLVPTLEQNCREKGGEFNSCGSPCPDKKGQVCAEVCAYTCELK